MRISLIQMNSTDNTAANHAAAADLIAAAAEESTELVSLPEAFAWLGPEPAKPGISESIPGPTSDFLAETAVRHGITVHGGSFFETAPDEKCYNCSLLLSPEGEIAAHYRKIHLFDAEIDGIHYRESEYVRPGTAPEIACLNGIMYGLSVCYDLRFPEIYREMSHQGADIIFIPAAFTLRTGEAHWETLLRARAIENQAFILAPAQAGTDPDGKEYYGHSMVIDPWGRILGELDGEPGRILTVDLDLGLIAQIRSQLPALRHRKL